MSEMLATQCPHCQTRFRLTGEQMRAASGKVRCGACLKIFDAISPAPAAPSVAPSTPPHAATPAPSQHRLLIHDDMDLDHLELEELGLDESLIEEIQASRVPPAPRHVAEQSVAGIQPARRQAPYELTPAADDFAAPPRTGRQPRPLQARRDEPEDQPEQIQDTRILPLIAEHSLDEELYLEDDPRPLRRRNRHNGLWTFLSLLALLGLAGQYLAYNFNALASDQRSRPLLERLCLLASCELPAQVDIGQLRSSNLVVRPHPEFPGTLAIDLILYNRAAFTQPFPVLQMTFTDSQGRTVAQRRFHPEEYLAGELAGVRLMPTQTPIHIGLSMLTPDNRYSGYHLDFFSP